MKQLLIAFSLCGTLTLLTTACNQAASGNATAPHSKEREALLEQYPEVPDAGVFFKEEKGKAVYEILKQRYTTHLLQLKNEVEATGAKLVVVSLTPEVGESVTFSTREGTPVILAAAAKAGIEAEDLSASLSSYKPEEITQMPRDGHWSKRGSQLIAERLAPVLERHAAVRSTARFEDGQRPATFGDEEPGMNQVLDGGKDLPYNVVTNAQGLRMDYDLAFPKAKQRILFLGDSQLFSPFLDNGDIFTGLLQKQYPDREFLNAGRIGYSVDDYLSLFREKAKYAEPDVVVVVTNPNDIADQYFTQRNRMGRSPKETVPAKEELELYASLFSKK